MIFYSLNLTHERYIYIYIYIYIYTRFDDCVKCKGKNNITTLRLRLHGTVLCEPCILT